MLDAALLKKSAALEEQAKQEVKRKAQLEDDNSRLTGKNFVRTLLVVERLDF